MLFTRCPGCQTTFRISVDTLRLAHGAVRCGNCATVFSAYTGLRQDALEEAPLEDDELLSPTLQTRELAGIEELAGPDFDENGMPTDSDAPAQAGDEAAVEIILETEPDAIDPSFDSSAEIRASTPPADDGSDLPVVEAAAGDEPAVLDDAASDAGIELEVLAIRDEPLVGADSLAEPTSAEGNSTKLHFEAPVDEWALLLSEIERSVDESSVPLEGEAESAPAREPQPALTTSPLPDPGDEPEYGDVGEPFSLDAYDDTAERRKLGTLEPRGAASREAERLEDAGAEIAAAADEAISAEEIDATLSAEPDPEIVAVLEAGLGQMPSEPPGMRRWALASLALTIVLGVQALHHFRAPLATQPAIGPALQRVYRLLGIALVPQWDLEQYEITNWAATAGPGSSGPGNLHITAQIRNRGPRAQPYPNILLELKDRWEAVIGARVFAPSEYLAEDSDTSGLMAAGTIVPADLTVVDPGLDASGFELDVCLEANAGRMTCSGDRVFE